MKAGLSGASAVFPEGCQRRRLAGSLVRGLRVAAVFTSCCLTETGGVPRLLPPTAPPLLLTGRASVNALNTPGFESEPLKVDPLACKTRRRSLSRRLGSGFKVVILSDHSGLKLGKSAAAGAGPSGGGGAYRSVLITAVNKIYGPSAAGSLYGAELSNRSWKQVIGDKPIRLSTGQGGGSGGGVGGS